MERRKLVGEGNEAEVKVDGKVCRTLLDTGSTVSTVSKGFYDKFLNSHRIIAVQNVLELEGAGGHTLPYYGYIEVDLEIPGISDAQQVLLLVVPDTRYSREVPLLLGTNMLRSVMDAQIKQHGARFLQKTGVSVPWQLTFKCMHIQDKQLDRRDGQLCTLKNAEGRPIVIHPSTAVTILGEADNKLTFSRCLGLSQPCSDGMISRDIEVTPALYTYDCRGEGIFQVVLSNPTTQTFVIQPRAKLCELHYAVEDDQMDFTSSDARAQPEWMDEINVNSEALTELQKKEVVNFLSQWKDIFSQNDLDIGFTNLVKHRINLSDSTPFKQRHRRIPPNMYGEVKEHLQQLLEGGIIRKSHSPWASNMVLVRKKDNSLRVCVDYRQLNANTVKDAYTLPRIDEMLDQLAGSSYFSILDMKSGYHQVELEESHKPRTAFTAGPLGFYEYNRLPFGLSNAPATYQRLMEECLEGLNHDICLVYLDDIIIFSDSYESHLERLGRVFDRLKDCGMKLSRKKCHLFQKRVKYVGHIVSAEGIEPDPAKLEKVRDWPAPTDADELRQFLGFAGYYRKFIRDFSKIAKPLNDLLGGGKKNCKRNNKKRRKVDIQPLPWKWGTDQVAAFMRLKELLISPPILGYADFSHPFELHTDASRDGLGAVLCQRIDGKQRVIAFASRGLSRAERNYSAYKLEFLALKWAISEKFHEYLYGNSFTVLTDNNPLTYVLTKAKLDATGHRWLASLSTYNFNIKYRPGKSNYDADALSRLPARKLDEQGYSEVTSEVIGALCKFDQDDGLVSCLAISVQEPSNGIGEEMAAAGYSSELGELNVVNWQKLQQDDHVVRLLTSFIENQQKPTRHDISAHPEMKPYIRVFDSLALRNGVLYRQLRQEEDTCWQLVLPEAYRNQALEGLHDMMGHLGRDRTLDLARQRFFWPGMGQDVKAYIKQCGRCLRRKSDTNIAAPLVNIETTQPLELVCLDFLTLETSKGGYKNILVITDHFTRYAQAIPTRNQTARTTAEALWSGFIVHYGIPKRIHTDQGANFCSKLMRELCSISGMEKTRTTPYHPMGNGMCERFNRTLLNMLGTLDPDQKADWKKYVGPMTHAYNSTKHSSTGFSPFCLMFGREPRLPIDLVMGLVIDGEAQSYTDFVDSLRKRLADSYELAKTTADGSRVRQKLTYDVRARAAVLDVGDRVLVKALAFDGKHKIANRWEEEIYVVLDHPNLEVPVYVVKKENGQGRKRTLHRNHLLPIGNLLTTPDQEPTSNAHVRFPRTRKQASKEEEIISGESLFSEEEDEYVIERHSPGISQDVTETPEPHDVGQPEVDQGSNHELGEDVEEIVEQSDHTAEEDQPSESSESGASEAPEEDVVNDGPPPSESVASQAPVADLESDEPSPPPSPRRTRSTRQRKPPFWIRQGDWIMSQRCPKLPNLGRGGVLKL